MTVGHTPTGTMNRFRLYLRDFLFGEEVADGDAEASGSWMDLRISRPIAAAMGGGTAFPTCRIHTTAKHRHTVTCTATSTPLGLIQCHAERAPFRLGARLGHIVLSRKHTLMGSIPCAFPPCTCVHKTK